MPEDDKTPGPWEIMRAIEAVDRSVGQVRDAMLTKDRFDEYQRGTDRRFESAEKRQAEWEGKSERAHGELEGKITAAKAEATVSIKALEDLLDTRDEKARDSRGRVWLAIGLLVAGVLAPRVWDILRGTGMAP